jgi:chromosome segregation ATPase
VNLAASLHISEMSELHKQMAGLLKEEQAILKQMDTLKATGYHEALEKATVAFEQAKAKLAPKQAKLEEVQAQCEALIKEMRPLWEAYYAAEGVYRGKEAHRLDCGAQFQALQDRLAANGRAKAALDVQPEFIKECAQH